MVERLFDSVYAIINTLMSTEKAFLQINFKRLIESEEARDNLEKLIPYVYGSALLSLSGKDINKETLSAVVSSAGIMVNPDYASIVSRVWNKSHLLYIYAYYFLLAFGKEDISKKDLLKVVRSLGADADEKTAEETLTFIKAKKKAEEDSRWG